ncbi:MAG: hypothetical protein AAFX65_02405 [Cyanobacteria bacterium J06638_7]
MTTPKAVGARHPRRRATGVSVLIPLCMALSGCGTKLNDALLQQGHQAMVECQHGERSITGGDELRCEDWDYVRENYLSAR